LLLLDADNLGTDKVAKCVLRKADSPPRRKGHRECAERLVILCETPRPLRLGGEESMKKQIIQGKPYCFISTII
jgi:hypothetical protein